MKAVVIEAAERAGLIDRDPPSPGPEEVLIRSRAAGICGSDVDLYKGTRPAGFYRYPVIPGHEWAGEVAAVGERVRDVAPGDKVVSEGFVYCGVCSTCRTGMTNLCRAGYDEVGFTRPGGWAEYVTVPAKLVHKLHPSSSLEEAALLEPTAVVADAFLRTRPQPGYIVAIVGDGPIGLLAVQLARLHSPAAIVLIGSREDRLELGRRLGATHAVHRESGDAERVVSSLDGGADLVIEAAGAPTAVEQAFRLARSGGAVALQGVAGAGKQVTLESDVWVVKHLSVLGTCGANIAAWEHATRLFGAGLLDLAPLISHRIPLPEYRTALDLLLHRREGAVKVLLTHGA